MSSFRESNHYKHFWYAIPIGLIGTILMVVGVAGGMEFKDKQYDNKWDWLDFKWTIVGGLIGQILQIVIILLFKYC